jgi:hypothetical protein
MTPDEKKQHIINNLPRIIEKLIEEDADHRGSAEASKAACRRAVKLIQGMLSKPEFDDVSTTEVLLAFYTLIVKKLDAELVTCEVPDGVVN